MRTVADARFRRCDIWGVTGRVLDTFLTKAFNLTIPVTGGVLK